MSEPDPSEKCEWLIPLASEILQAPVDPDESLVAQGLESVTALALLESIRDHGYEADYAELLNEASIRSLASSLRPLEITGLEPGSAERAGAPVPVSGPQTVWTEIEELGWGSWANISLCLSLPGSLVPAAYLPAMIQSLCDENDAMRMVLVPCPSGNGVLQHVIPDFRVPVRMEEAPALEKEVMRMMEAFEGEAASPYDPSTRALILSSTRHNERHWLCITMHHVFVDRVGMHALARQLRTMILKGPRRLLRESTPDRPRIDFLDYALWQARVSEEAGRKKAEAKLRELLSNADISARRPLPRLARREELDLGTLPSSSTLSAAQGAALEILATRLRSTVPLLLHSLFSALVPRLTGAEETVSGETDTLLCHVVSNRESHPSLRNLAGCFDTSIPVAVQLTKNESLLSLCKRTRKAFAATHPHAASLPRGGWFGGDCEGGSGGNRQHTLFERVAHINIIRTPGEEIESATTGIRTHSLRRVQKTRWGMLLRVVLPPEGGSRSSENPSAPGARVSAFSEDPPLATLAHHCFVELIRELLGESPDTVGEFRVMESIGRILDRAAFASAQVRRASALVSDEFAGDPFIWNRLIERQQRWYRHDDHRELLRDEQNRFVGTVSNPFPFTQLDKLAERNFLDSLDVPQSRVLHVLPKEGLPASLVQLAPSLPDSFAIKPVGAGHSFGVSLIRDGIDLTRNGAPFDAETIGMELSEMAERGFCLHEDHVFRFNFSSFLIEELVVDENGFDAPTDYKVFVIGGKILWIQVHFKEDGHTWVAFVDEHFEILSQPCWDPATCWRTHRALVCTDQAMVASREPGCFASIVEHSKRLGSRLGIFVRLDWNADRTHGPLMGEITTFPHMLQPRAFYSGWANRLVEKEWAGLDGGAPPETSSIDEADTDLLARTEEIISSRRPEQASLEDFLPPSSQAPWALGADLSYGALREYVADFDLAPWGILGGDCVALLVENGQELGGLILAVMNRYVALPFDPKIPAGLLKDQLRESAVRGLVVVAGSEEARVAESAVRSIPGLVVIELEKSSPAGFAELPARPGQPGDSARTPGLGPDDEVLVLRTSGTTGEPKIVRFTLSRLMRAGAGIAQSLRLRTADLGVSMLPLHHIGGISCNLIAPMIAGAPMRFFRAFDPKSFFEAVGGPGGATWCYLVPTMWEMLLGYARSHPDFSRTRPWPRLRVVRSAGADLPHSVALELAELFGDTVGVLPTYGMTEAMPIAAPPPSYRLECPGSVGPILPSVSVEIVNPSGSGAVPVGEIGEVTVTGPTVVPRNERDAHIAGNEFTPRGYYRTGDLGRLAADGSGWLYITGRIKDAINRGGETIAPAEVEAELRKYPGWKKAGAETELMVFARSHSQLGEDVGLAFAPLSAEVELTHLSEWTGQHLPPSMQPKTLVRLPELPHSTGGKLLRSRFATHFAATVPPCRLGKWQLYSLESPDAIPDLLEEFDESGPPDSPSGDHSDSTLQSVLAIARRFVRADVELGPDTRFDDAGINSLAAVELSERLSHRFSVELPGWITSDYPTARALLSQLPGGTEAACDVTPPVAGSESPDPEPFPSRPIRLLFLHGEGADADLVELSMRATKWLGQLEGRVEFLFADAPHLCPPKPGFHPIAVEAGFYEKSTYRSWGATDPETLEQSIASVFSKLEKLAPVDGIGGICDGGLIAALVASRHPDIQLFLNIASSPLARLPGGGAEAGLSIACRSIHLISSRDEMLSLDELLDLPKHCRRAFLLQHDSGHSIPALDGDLKRELLSFLDLSCPESGAGDGLSESPAPVSWESAAETVSNAPIRPRRTGEDQTALGETVRRIWAYGLTIDREGIGYDDNFDALGGDSLATLRILRELEKNFDVDLRNSFRTGFKTVRKTVETLHALGVDRNATGKEVRSRDPSDEYDPDLDLRKAYHGMLRSNDWVQTQLKGDEIALFATPAELSELLTGPAKSFASGNGWGTTSLKNQFLRQSAVLVRLRWRRRVVRFIRKAPDFAHQWRRTNLFRDAILYHSSEGDRSGKTLVVGFCGNAMRLMIPAYMMLSSLDPRRYDLLLLKDPDREHYSNGVKPMGNSIEDMASYLREYVIGNSYEDGIALGTSAGGLASVYMALENGWAGAVAFGCSDPNRHPGLAKKIAKLGSRDSCPPIVVNYGEKNDEDRISAANLKALLPTADLRPDPRFRRHNVVYSLLLSGELAPLLESQFATLRGFNPSHPPTRGDAR